MMTDQIKFRPGQMVAFISTRGFALGNTNLSISEGMEVLFDGTNVEVGGQRYLLPTLRGAIKLGWLVPSEQYNPDAPLEAAPSADIQVRSANDLGQNPMQPVKKFSITTVESDERIVMNRSQRATAAMQQTQAVRAQQQQQRGGGVARSFNGSSGVEVGGAEFGVPVARAFQTPARAETKVTPDSVGSAIRQADQVKVQPGEGMSEHELLARMTEDERSLYLAEKEARKSDVMSRTAGYSLPQSQTTNLAAYNQPGMQQQPRQASAQPQRAQMAPQSRVVGQVPQGQKVLQTEGFNVALTTGGGTEIADLSGMGGQAHESSVTAEGITFKNTNGPKRAFPNMTSPQAQPAAPMTTHQMAPEEGTSRIEKDGTADARKSIAKTLCKDFPDEYSFSDHWKRRLAMIRLNYEGRIDVIRAIFAAESDDFKKVILDEFPEAFAS